MLIDNPAVHHTGVEVRAHDEPALLYRLTKALLAADVVVTGAKIDTLGSEVVDAFFVTDRARCELWATTTPTPCAPPFRRPAGHVA